MMRSLFTAVTGLESQRTAMDVIGHNLANVNTVGYKKQRAFFQDLFYQNLASATAPTATRPARNPVQVGLGARVASIDTIFSQGSFENTGNPTDVAIEGRGFFVVKYGDETYYTRAGNFKFDPSGALVDTNGFRVQGYRFNEQTGEWETVMEDIVINPNEQLPPRATDTITLKANLSSSATGNTYETWEIGPFRNSAAQTIKASATSTYAIFNSCMAEDITTGDYIDILGTGHAGTSVTGRFYLTTGSSTLDSGGIALTWDTNTSLTAGATDVTHTVDSNSYVIVVNASSSSTLKTGQILGPGETFTVSANGSIQVRAVGSFEDLQLYLQYIYGDDYQVKWDDNGNLLLIDKTCGDSLMSIKMRFQDADNSGSELELPGVRVAIEGKYADKHIVTTTIYDKTGQAHELKITYVKIQGEDADDNGSFFSASASDDPSKRKSVWVFYTELDGELLEVDGAMGRVEFDTEGVPSITYYYAHYNYTTAGGTATYDIGAFGSLPGLAGNAFVCPDMKCPVNFNVDIDGDGYLTFTTTAGSTVKVSLKSLNETGAQLGIHLESFDSELFDSPVAINVYDEEGNLLLKSLGGDSRTYYVKQNGYAPGDLIGIEIDDHGVVEAYYSNGVSLSRYRLALAGFNNEQGLKHLGRNLYAETPASGAPFYAAPGEQGLGQVRSYSLEMSNVDIAEEFTKMIITQRGFQANARVITTSDEMLQDIIALKR